MDYLVVAEAVGTEVMLLNILALLVLWLVLADPVTLEIPA
jgi:hypothetical protein